MKFVLQIDCDNAAFGDSHRGRDLAPEALPEVARILRETADAVESGDTGRPILDANGNTVGFARFQ